LWKIKILFETTNQLYAPEKKNKKMMGYIFSDSIFFLFFG